MVKYIDRLRKCTCIADLVSEFKLKITAKEFGYVVYHLSDDLKYEEFYIPKKNGTLRRIHSPKPALKYIQKEFSSIIFNCINEIRLDNINYLACNHAFERDKSIVSNANLHKNKKFILNIDINDFFGSIHYGRIKGFLANDSHFKLNEKVSQIIARLATCHKILPQGSPLSPILATLIGNLMDVRFLKLAKKYLFTYSRYADDITLSSNKTFDKDIIYWCENNKKWVAGKTVINILTDSGFAINPEKTRVSYSNDRQTVTGVVVNKQRNVTLEYRRTNRAMVYSLLSTGSFRINGNAGNIAQLMGRLNHSIYIKYYDSKFPAPLDMSERIKYKEKKQNELIKVINNNWKPDKKYIPCADHQMRLLRSVIYFKYIINVEQTTIFPEGFTDPIYFSKAKENLNIHSNIKFQKINNGLKKIGLLGGASSVNTFIHNVKEKIDKFISHKQIRVIPKHPVIFILDYDDGLDGCGFILDKIQIEQQYLFIRDNIYVLLLKPKGKGKNHHKIKENMACIENFILFENKRLEPDSTDSEAINFKGKIMKKGVFAKYLSQNPTEFDYKNFSEIFSKIEEIEKDYAKKLQEK
ncbi:reverse transcriptase domain-containing protein [Exercitatus varius]|uniref:reverse transcriptase domain-containing protein n=1 Tax=Exercitatus varius TaxID=67857 RepID=UPI00294AF567|nr:reverse transcriptase domain-containing protein [Exercitatus varius]MDG2941200.1 reverse transcriptase domain-containing protein [Exercitatus varius]